jgi:type IV pilus assembly protein PilB
MFNKIDFLFFFVNFDTSREAFMQTHFSPIRGVIRKILIEKGTSEAQFQKYVQDAELSKQELVQYFIEKNYIESSEFVDFISSTFDISKYVIDPKEIASLPRTTMPEMLLRTYHFLPINDDPKEITIVAANPYSEKMLEAVKFNMNKKVVVVVGDYHKINSAIEKYYASDYGMADNNFDDAELDNVILESTADSNGKDENPNSSDDAPIVKFVNKILLEAIKVRASDIHFEPYEKFYRIRLRIDGILRETPSQPNIILSGRLSARLKVMSNMDIAEKRRPQDGRIKIKVSRNQTIDFRVNTLPTLYGEKIVLRILDPSSAQLGIDALGYEKSQKELYMAALYKPQGMILVTGPTGSGKTVSLYTGINILNTPEINISTAEDPVEINLPGINQVNINLKSGMNFSNALRAFLRQDPDVIMVGEIRDLETAEIAIKAAQTGHMVMSTLHTNSASETLTRLRNMGVPSFNIATSINLIIAQRLARKLCPHCKVAYEIPDSALIGMGFKEEDLGFTLYKPHEIGCEECTRGYRGRVGVYEVVKITPRLSSLIMNDANAIEISKVCREEGFNDLRRSALIKVKDGITSLDEVNRITIE